MPHVIRLAIPGVAAIRIPPVVATPSNPVPGSRTEANGGVKCFTPPQNFRHSVGVSGRGVGAGKRPYGAVAVAADDV